MSRCFPVENLTENIIPTENIIYFDPEITEYESINDMENEDQNSAIVTHFQDEQDQVQDTYLESLFLTNLLPSSLLVPAFPPQGVHHTSKRGGRVFNKRTRKYTGCLINLGLGHNCDYKEAIGAAQEAQHWDNVG